MIRRRSLRELLGVVLVVVAALIALGQRRADLNIIESLTLASLLFVCVAAFKPWPMRSSLLVASVSGALAVLVLSLGLGAAALIPLAAAIHHSAMVAWEIFRSPEESRVALREGMRKKPAPPRHEPPPKLDDDPFRSPPQAPPILVRRPPTEPTTVPIARNDAAAKPTLLD